MKSIRSETLVRPPRDLDPRPVGLDGALSEMGPNHLTEFADALVIEGVRKPGKEFYEMWDARGVFRGALADFLSGVNHAFIGGVASRSYGARLGPTQDYDVMIDREHLKGMTAFLEKRGATLKSTVEDTYQFRVASLKFDVDVRVARSSLDREALAKAKGASYEGRKLRIVRAEHLAAMKAKSYSERREIIPQGPLDAEDIRGLIAVGKTTASAVRAVLRRHRPDLLPVLEEILSGPARR